MSEWTFPISPVAASRPRVSRRGAYFVGPYKIFRKEMIELVPLVLGNRFKVLEGPLKVDIEIYVKRPKKTKLDAPKADIDNYIKAILDSLNKKLWVDDTQIREIYACKQWARPRQHGHFIIGVEKLKEKK
jgi:Holliday junction resolvase RusA-like endonuclease|tara:strand:- start:860 stop:1249 length:390 start_codon:yes stop_codon:yes gene_type:complete